MAVLRLAVLSCLLYLGNAGVCVNEELRVVTSPENESFSKRSVLGR